MLKLGFHCNRLGQDVFNTILKVKPGIIKTLDPNVDFFKDVLSPDRNEVFNINRE